MTARWREDRGSTLLLIIGTAALSLALVIGVMAASSLYLERKRLFTIADGAALNAAQSFDTLLAPTQANPHPRLSNSSVSRSVQLYLSRLTTSARHRAVLTSATSPDARTAVVTMQSTWHPPVVSIFMPSGLTISATASARTFH